MCSSDLIEPSKNIDKKGNLESFNKRFEIFAQNVEIAFNSGKYVVDIVNEANVLRKNAENSMISYPVAENRLEELEKKLKLAKERLPEKANVKISTTIKKVDTESSNPFYTSFQDFKANATKKELNPHGYIVQFQDETTKIEIAAYLEHVLTYNEVYSTIFIWYVDKKFSRFTISISGYEDSKIPMVKNLLVKSGATNFKVDVDGSLSFQYNLK